MSILLQQPSVVQPIAMSIFMASEPPYSLQQADADVMALSMSLNASGISTAFLSDALFYEKGPHVPREVLLKLAAQALRLPEQAPTALRERVVESFSSCSRHELSEIVLMQPTLRLFNDDELGMISPDTAYEKYEIQPLYGLLFPRDHFINVGGQPIFGRLKRQDRSRETDVMKAVISAYGHTLVSFHHTLEGGDYQENERVSIINTGFRTDARVLPALLASGFLKTDILLAVEDLQCDPWHFHLDHYACLLHDALILDARRADSLRRSKVSVYRRTEAGWSLANNELTLREAAQVAELDLILLDDTMMAAWCANMLTVGKDLWLDDAAPRRLLDQLEARDYIVHCVRFSEHKKQSGSVHCSTQTV